MSLSKHSLNSFANQYNIAITTKALYFKVENTVINRQILNLLYKEGLINSYAFRQEDLFSEENKNNQELKCFTQKVQRQVDSKLYFFDLLSLMSVRRSLLPTLVIGDQAQKQEDLVSNINLKECSLKEFSLLLFIHKLLHLFYTLKNQTGDNVVVKVYNRFFDFRFIPTSSLCLKEEASWQFMLFSILDLKQYHDQKNMLHLPKRFVFIPEYEELLLKYLEYMLIVDLAYEEHRVITRAELQLDFFQDHWWYQDTLFEDDRILVYPRYSFGKAVVKKIETCGGTVVWRYVSLPELNFLKQNKGYTTLYLVSTSKGLVLDYMNSLLMQEGGLLLLEIKI